MPIDPTVLVLIAAGITIIALLTRFAVQREDNLEQTLDAIPEPHPEEESIIYQSGNF